MLRSVGKHSHARATQLPVSPRKPNPSPPHPLTCSPPLHSTDFHLFVLHLPPPLSLFLPLSLSFSLSFSLCLSLSFSFSPSSSLSLFSFTRSLPLLFSFCLSIPDLR